MQARLEFDSQLQPPHAGFTGIRDWIAPNFYFHVTMVYALLRNSGLAIGKMDFMPQMARHEVAPEQGASSGRWP